MYEHIYFVFHKNNQPLQSEIGMLDCHMADLNGVAWGIDKNNQQLVACFDREAFENHLEKNHNFCLLVDSWKERGEVKNWCNFATNSNALKPTDDETRIIDKGEIEREQQLNKLQKIAEAKAESGLRLQYLKDGINHVGEASKFVPWVLGGVVAAGTVYTGYKLGKAISEMEPRRDTIQRVIDNPMEANLRAGDRHNSSETPEIKVETPNRTQNSAGKGTPNMQSNKR